MTVSLDLNADVGEGFPDDRELLDVISSANVACGFHAGDGATMRQLAGWCAQLGVAVGAQVSYRDRAGFGRRAVEIGYDDLRGDIEEQLDLLQAAAEQAGVPVAYLKPHGALYHRVTWDEAQAQAVLDASRSQGLPVLGLPGSVICAVAEEQGREVALEFFADRGYSPDGTLVARTEPAALVTDPALVARRVAQLVESGTVTAADGSLVAVKADSICVHGDSAGAAELARVVARVLTEHDIVIRPFS